MASTSSQIEVNLTINGEKRKIKGLGMERLLDVLRSLPSGDHQLTGTKEGCGEGECGACSVLMNGKLVNSCLVPFGQCQDADITTIEGVAKNGEWHPIQQSFLEKGGAQCGICTPGMVLASIQLLRENPNPTLNDIKDGLAGNFCRCTGYTKIFDSVLNSESCSPCHSDHCSS